MAEKKTTDEFKATFVELLQEIPNVTAICKLMGVSTSTIREARKADPKFDVAVGEAIEDGYDLMEEEARRRAVEGVLEPVFFQGVEVGAVRKYSDSLLTTLLKAYRPKKFNPGAGVAEGIERVIMKFNMGEGK